MLYLFLFLSDFAPIPQAPLAAPIGLYLNAVDTELNTNLGKAIPVVAAALNALFAGPSVSPAKDLGVLIQIKIL